MALAAILSAVIESAAISLAVTVPSAITAPLIVSVPDTYILLAIALLALVAAKLGSFQVLSDSLKTYKLRLVKS